MGLTQIGGECWLGYYELVSAIILIQGMQD